VYHARLLLGPKPFAFKTLQSHSVGTSGGSNPGLVWALDITDLVVDGFDLLLQGTRLAGHIVTLVTFVVSDV
jgi:hypothetical protein